MFRRRLLCLVVAVVIGLPGAGLPVAASASSDCPMSAHDCCPAVLTCCTPGLPSSAPAMPVSAQSAPASTQVALAPSGPVWDLSAGIDPNLQALTAFGTRDRRQLDLLVFLSVFLI